MTATTNNRDYSLNSDLARFCLPGATLDSEQQKLAWVDSLCLAFLIIGFVGIKPPELVIKAVPPIDEPVVTVIEHSAAPPVQQEKAEEQPEQTDNDVSDATALVAVTLDVPSINFSVPTIGVKIVEASKAVAPPAQPLRQYVAPTNFAPVRIMSTGKGGDYPSPLYPTWALDDRMQGSLLLSICTDQYGTVTSVEVQESTGYPRLDNHVINHVKRRWVFPQGTVRAVYEAPFQFRIN